jgi:hypothetical protein
MTINCRGSTAKSLLACKHGFPVLQHVHACQPSTGAMHEFDINIHDKRKSCFLIRAKAQAEVGRCLG